MSLWQRLQARFQRLSGRSRAVGMFFATSVLTRGIGISCQLIQVPIVMRVLGPEAFGLWMTLTSVGFVLTFADFGMGQGAQNKLAEAFAAGRDDVARELWSSTLAFFGAMAALLAAAVFVVTRTVDFTALFNLSDPAVQAQARAAATVTLFLYCLNFPLALAQRLAYSRQQGWMHNIAQSIGGVGALAGVVLATQLHWQLPGIIAAALTPLLLANAGLLTLQLHRLGWLDVRLVSWRGDRIRELLGLGAFFGIQQVQLMLLISLPQLVISTALGAAAVTPYNLTQRLFNLFAVIQNAFMLPLWPAYSDAKARGEFGWIRRTLFFSLRATALCTILPMAIGACVALPVLRFWAGPTAPLPSVSLVALLFCWNALLFIQQPFGYLLAGLSEVRRLTGYAVASTVLCAVLMHFLVHAFAQDGVVLGLIVGFLPFLLFGNIAEVMRVLRAIPGRPTPEVHPNPVPPMAENSVNSPAQT